MCQLLGMNVSSAAAGLEAGEGKADVGRYVAVHPEQLAHRSLLFRAHGWPLADLDLQFDDVLIAAQAER